MGGLISNVLGFFGAGAAGRDIYSASQAGEQGILNATSNATQDVTDTLGRNSQAVIDAQNNAIGNYLNPYTNYATNTLGGGLGAAESNVNPFITAGQWGNAALGNYAQALPQYNTNPYNTGNPYAMGGVGQGMAAPAGIPNRMAPQGGGGLAMSPLDRRGGFAPPAPGQPSFGIPNGAAAAPGGGPPQFGFAPGSGRGGAAGQFSFMPTMQQLEATPGYQFARQEGLNAIQNGNAASGLGQSSNQNLDAAKFATGLASQTYQNAFQNAAQQFGMNQNAFNQTFQNAQQGFNTNQNAYNQAFQQGLGAFGENQNLRLNSLGMLQGAGLQGAGLGNQALLGLGVPAAEMQYNTGLNSANMINQNARFNAQQGLQGTEFNSGLLLPAAEQAGQFALTGAGANAAATMAQFQNIAGGVNQLGGLATGLLGL